MGLQKNRIPLETKKNNQASQLVGRRFDSQKRNLIPGPPRGSSAQNPIHMRLTDKRVYKSYRSYLTDIK